MYGDKIRVSHSFQDCQLLACLAERQKGGGSLVTSLQYQTFLETQYLSDTLEMEF